MKALISDIHANIEALEALAGDLERERDLLQTVMENTHAQLAYLDAEFTFLSDQEGVLLDRLNIRHVKGYLGRDIAFPTAIIISSSSTSKTRMSVWATTTSLS